MCVFRRYVGKSESFHSTCVFNPLPAADVLSHFTERPQSVYKFPELSIVDASPVHPDELPCQVALNPCASCAQLLSFLLLVAHVQCFHPPPSPPASFFLSCKYR